MMFGSKIRSWMENHIVRPRKKGNKNKNGSSSNNSSVPTTNFNTQSGYLGTSYGLYNADSIPGQNTMAVIGNGTNSVPSPARRHEVSPIQYHKTSRFGWHSPTHGNKNQIMSPKSEHFLKMQHQSDNTKIPVADNKINNMKPEQGKTATNTIFRGGNQDNMHNMYNNNNNNSKSNNTQYNLTTVDDRNHKMNTSNADMLKNKCYSINKQNIMDHQHIQQHRNIRSNQREFDEQNNKFLSYKTSDKEYSTRTRNKFENTSSSHVINHMNSNNTLECNQSLQFSDKKQFKRITEFEANNSANNCHQSKINFQNNNGDVKSYTKLCHEVNSDIITNTSTKPVSSSSSFAKTYKKIFSGSSASSSSAVNDRHVSTSQILNDSNYDQINANILPHYYQHQQYQKTDNSYYGNNNNANNNNNNNNNINNNNNNNNNNADTNSIKEKMKKSDRKQLTESGYYEMICGVTNSKQHPLNSRITSHQATIHVPSKSKCPNPTYEINRITNTSTNYLVMGSTNLHNRNGRQNNTIGPIAGQPPPPNSNHPLAHVINSLSSPESAYSTGYSTDGTSPGTTYTPPEYYINMRTGTHYFPKNANSLGIELSRQKFGLNKIEEILSTHHHRRTESYDLNQIKVTHMELIDGPNFMNKENFQKQHIEQIQHFEKPQNHNNSTQFQTNNALAVNCKGYESPSPRQRCRIRTNPWYSTPESSFSATSQSIKKTDLDTSSSSSGIKSNSDIRTSIVDDEKSKESSEVSDDESESSSTEVEVDISKKASIRGTLKQSDDIAIEISRPLSTDQVFNVVDFSNKNHNIKGRSFKNESFATHLIQQDSDADEDTTLNEMMGKFDESYIYEKETDILSNDSDPTHCNSDIDTGQDAGDEYDTEDLLDIDFIDTGSIQEIVEKSEAYKNTGNCSYYNYNPERRLSKTRKSRKHNEELAEKISASGKRKKRLLKTRKKSCESKERNVSPLKSKRESRSVGGTPVCLRRKISSRDKKHETKISPLVHQQRSSSLTLTEVHTVREKYIAIAESEKMLLKADLEADIKYKQLIHEAESILVSMKANAISIPRETPVASPSRRILNPPANKRVEMLRQCEADLKREIQKQQQQQQQLQNQDASVTTSEHLINKRLEMLRHEYNSCNSVPTSPKCGRLSPRKTHLTNFINQIASSDIAWRNPTSNKNRSNEHLSSDDQQNFNIRCNRHLNRESSSSPPPPVIQPPPPPIPRRNFGDKSSGHTFCSNYSNSNSEEDLNEKSIDSYSSKKSTIEVEVEQRRKQDNEYNKQDEHYNEDHQNHHQHHHHHNHHHHDHQIDNESELNSDNYIFQDSDFMTKSPTQNKQPLISFKSVDMGNRIIEMGGYCPQSEPLKRKIYKGSSSFERIKKSLDIDSEMPKQNMLNKVHSIRHDHQNHSNRSSTQDINSNLKNIKSSSNSINNNNNNNNNNNQYQNNHDQSAYQSNDEDTVSNVSNLSVKQQLILNTIEDLKKSLEDQSVELTAQFENTKIN